VLQDHAFEQTTDDALFFLIEAGHRLDCIRKS
jgi:hypothetical protein